MLDRSKNQTVIGAIWQRWRDWARAQSEFELCGEEGMERMAHDAAVSVNELRQLSGHGPELADLLPQRMAALDLDPEEVKQVEPQVFRDLPARLHDVQKPQAMHRRFDPRRSKSGVEGLLPERPDAHVARRAAVVGAARGLSERTDETRATARVRPKRQGRAIARMVDC